MAELTALNELMRGTGTVEAFERELVTRVYAGALAWLGELDGPELTRDQRRRWNAAVRRVNRYVPRGGVTMTCRVLRSLNQSRDLLADHHVLKTAIVAAAAHGPVPAASRRPAETARTAPSSRAASQLAHTGV
ncbi:hypothetical protein [Kocuria tytonis]|uniref:hypothetical protein n=1 Tax=Kocuria tytonis TaxID=2054280 RepID=UPI001F396F19|nr:hypothetical protein [Kocuria tytonis]